MAVSFLLINCRSKQITTHQQEQKTEIAERLIEQEENVGQTSVSSEEIQTQIKEIQELISNINVSFDGKAFDDKLDILLSKSVEGTKLTFQGKGNVSYSQSIKSEMESVKNEIIKRQDSIFQRITTQQQQIQQKLDYLHKEENKEVKGSWEWLLPLGYVLCVVFVLWKIFRG